MKVILLKQKTKVELLSRYGYWGEHPEFPLEDWKYEVRNDDTRAGYWEWVVEGMGEQS